MSSTLDRIRAHFGHTDLYRILHVKKTATESELKTAYRKQALKHHPDKNLDNDDATEKFQLLCTIHAVLSNADSRAVYDETGEIEADSSTDTKSFNDWVAYWRALFPPLTENDITSFEATYRGSAEESKDLLEAYKKHKGKWQNILDVVILARDEDIDRFEDIIQAAIDDGSVPLFPAFKKKPVVAKKSASARKKQDAEAKAAEDLIAQIRGRNGRSAMAKRSAQFDSLLSKLEDKYAPDDDDGESKPSKKRHTSKSEEPSEEEFLAAQRRLEKNKRKE
ncbi:hypothetical protein H310_03455 [Aphanomyces invadans]|uniref:J domain-containing protein n=1 Tax=Aphanomyces invadans TaxID=157072 RepID=A0A024UH75_9STRA|nr:hypothetical protein H310_03455 [Aphanomyces invadans]ETW05771.1 hypothetical protein H310_03455 [Aphanomyces invadans]|eukprot:XP_008865548.1 hypothetical protein H310_03455 [Aphanomyces invadans]